MITADMIPDEVVEAAAIVLHANAEIFSDILWDDLGADDKEAYCLEARATIAAALTAWPGSFPHTFRGSLEGYGFVLPMPLKDVQNAGR